MLGSCSYLLDSLRVPSVFLVRRRCPELFEIQKTNDARATARAAIRTIETLTDRPHPFLRTMR